MTVTSLIPLLAAAANLVLLCYVFRRRHTRPVHFAFALLVALISAWMFCNSLISLIDSLPMLNVVGRLAFSIAALISGGYVVFTWTFPETSHPRPRPWVKVVLATASVSVNGVWMESSRLASL